MRVRVCVTACYGFGEPLDYLPEMYTGDMGRGWHESTLWGIGDYLGVTLDEVTSSWETSGLDFDFQAALGLVKAGTTAAIRWTMTGMYKGKPLVIYRKIERIHPDAGREFEQPLHDDVEGTAAAIEARGHELGLAELRQIRDVSGTGICLSNRHGPDVFSRPPQHCGHRVDHGPSKA